MWPWPSVPTSNPSNKKATLLWNRAGKATDPAPAIIVVDAVAAHADGVRCFASGPLFLAENVPLKFLSLDQK